MFSWFNWSSRTSKVNSVEQHSNSSTVPEENNINPSFQIYRFMVSETKKQDVGKVEKFQANVNQAVDHEVTTFQNFFNDWQIEIQQKSSEPSQSISLSDNDSQLIENFQILVNQFRNSIISFFAMIDCMVLRTISTENKNALSFTLVNQFQIKQYEDAIKSNWQQLSRQLQQSQFNEQQSLFLVLFNLNILMLDTILNHLKQFKENANHFIEKVIASEQLYQFHQIEESLQKWVIWPLAVTLNDLKAKQEEIQNIYHQPFQPLQRDSNDLIDDWTMLPTTHGPAN